MNEEPEEFRDDFSLLLAGAVLHPLADQREKLMTELKGWISLLQPKYAIEEIERFLDTQKGTALEPFVLKKTDRAMVSLFVQAAFSQAIECTRILVRSSDKIGDGSLLITQSLNSNYLESYVYGKRIRIKSKPWFFDARESPDFPYRGLGVLFGRSANISCDEQGIRILLQWPAAKDPHLLARFDGKNILGWADESSFRLKSFFKSDESTLPEAGLALNLDEETLTIQTTTPESTIRLLARISRGETLVLDEEGSSFLAEVSLKHPDEEQIATLPTKFLAKQNPLTWIRTNCPVPYPELSEESKEIISNYLIPYSTWRSRALQAIEA